MSNAPETIYTCSKGKWLVAGNQPHWPTDVEYRRADLPPTLEQALNVPEIKALVDASKAAKLALAEHEPYPIAVGQRLASALAALGSHP